MGRPRKPKSQRDELVSSITASDLTRQLGEKAWNYTIFKMTGNDGLVEGKWNKGRLARYTNQQWAELPEEKRVEECFAQLDGGKKLRAIAEFGACVMALPEVRQRYVEAAMEDPLAAMRLLVAMMPKDVNIEVNTNTGVVVLPTPKAWDEWKAKAECPKVIEEDDYTDWFITKKEEGRLTPEELEAEAAGE